MVAPSTGLRDALERSLGRFIDEYQRYSYIEAYLTGKHDPPYVPKHAHREYRNLLQQSVLNFLPLIVTAVAQQLYVEGYRKPDSPDDDSAWEYWRRNSMDAWQHSAHRDALSYGVSYILVLPGDKAPVIRPVSPLAMTALYEDPIHDEWPVWALHHSIDYTTGTKRSKVHLYDATNVHTYVGDYALGVAIDLDSFELVETKAHGLGVCPVVRMRNTLSLSPNVAPAGEIESLIPTQDRLNNLVLSESMIAQYASFRQRWATGLVIPEDPATGRPVEPFNAAVNRLWVSDSTDTKFGEFAESDITKILAAINETVKHMSAISQVPPVYLLGDIVNMSAEALAASEAGLQRKVTEKRTVFGEAWAQVMRLAVVADGATTAESQYDNRIVWRDTEARSMASTVDALGKLSQMLHVPPEALWERVPGVTSSDVAAWKQMAQEADSLRTMLGMLDSQAATLGARQARPAGRDKARPGTNIPGVPTTAEDGHGTPSEKKRDT
ncbi:hypothetical protein GCM10012275_07960 [Longimycelium tulufanense]|uniref:Phage portal protein n=1 Tax=Longimycelium tulufanense TaxID=907463 RepID=A0A8J3C9I1_9PSEU|nr:phage portal protein [Longimycelium tulufanense]GGM39486.1 hypothetical protein GCM10012275_07960 [Longimycelium tulufanense]